MANEEKKGNEVATVSPKQVEVKREFQITDAWTSEEITVIRNMLAKDLTDSEFKMFLMSAKQLGANPLRKDIYASVFTDSRGNRTLTLITSIDYLRGVATGNPRYNGTSDAKFGDLIEVDFKGKNNTTFKVKVPEYAKISIYLKDADLPVEATTFFTEFLPAQETKQFMWKKMPRNQIAKCAEALCIRKAFPKETGQVYTEDEKHLIGRDANQVTLEGSSPQLVNGLKELLEKKGMAIEKILKKFGVETLEEIDQKQGRLLYQTLQGMPDKAPAVDKPTEQAPEPKEAEIVPEAKNEGPTHDPKCEDPTCKGTPCQYIPTIQVEEEKPKAPKKAKK